MTAPTAPPPGRAFATAAPWVAGSSRDKTASLVRADAALFPGQPRGLRLRGMVFAPSTAGISGLRDTRSNPSLQSSAVSRAEYHVGVRAEGSFNRNTAIPIMTRRRGQDAD